MTKKLISVAAATLILSLVVFSLTGVASAQTRSAKQALHRNLEIFTSVYKTLQNTYVDSIDIDKTTRAAIDAMLDEIDPYTTFYSEDDTEELTSISSGDFGGIGAYILQNEKQNTVISLPQPGTPAQKVGLKAGDIIVAVDSDTVLTLGSEKVRAKLRGPAGTKLNLKVARPYIGPDSILDFEITRAKIDIKPIDWYGMLADSIGFITLNTFNGNTTHDVTQALKELIATPGIKGLILDLRGNGGGLLESAVDVLSLFLPKGTEVLRTRGRNNSDEKIYKTTRKPIAPDLPLAVLIDYGSASASEVTAGVLQDLDRAVIVGERSYGKGLVQSSRAIPYGGILKVTTAKYYIPSGRLIQAIDYSHRNPDGSVARTPDSLTNVYHTLAGREVRDGGGITPDVSVSRPNPTSLTANIVLGHWDFDFSTWYAAHNDTIPTADKFEITDTIYTQFKNFIDPDRLKPDRICDTLIDNLRKGAELEGYLNDDVKAQIDTLEKMLRHDLDVDLDIQRPYIETYLANEIISRYYPGTSFAYFTRHDNTVSEATSILSDPARYKELLSPKQSPKK